MSVDVLAVASLKTCSATAIISCSSSMHNKSILPRSNALILAYPLPCWTIRKLVIKEIIVREWEPSENRNQVISPDSKLLTSDRSIIRQAERLKVRWWGNFRDWSRTCRWQTGVVNKQPIHTGKSRGQSLWGTPKAGINKLAESTGLTELTARTQTATGHNNWTRQDN